MADIKNEGKTSTSKKGKKKKKKNHRVFWFFVKAQIVLMFLVMGALGYYYIGGYAKKVEELRQDAITLVKESTEDTFRATETSVVYDVNGNQISTLKGEKDTYYLTFGQIPADAVNAMVSIEDKKFYSHIGIDFKAIVRAAVAMVKNGEVTQGGSTITQQLARNIFLSTERSWQRKVEEIFIAVELERKYTKNQIMEFYLNNIYFANGYYGIEAAAQGYFSCSVEDLDLAQITFLCAIPNNPSLYDPEEHPENTIKRRDRILYAMLQDKVITDAKYEKNKNEVITLKQTEEQRHDYVETFTYYCAIRELMKINGFQFQNTFSSETEREAYEASYDELYEACQQSLFTSGYRIYTSIDMDKEKELQNAIDENLKEYTETAEDGTYKLQSAGVCIDNETGRVVAIVGGRSQDSSGYTLNRAYQSFRQPGSSIKPLIVYTPSLERNYTPDSIVHDTKLKDGPSQGSYLGDITLRTAVEKSKNVVAWQLFDELTPEVGLQYLLNMNFSNITANDYFLPASLGGFYKGVSPLEMASAYATLENDGYYREPTCIVKITDSEGDTILETQQMETSIYQTNAARMMTDIMTGVLIRGTAKGKGISQTITAGKTGTTNDNKDGWFCGFSYYYTTSIWVGFDIPKKLSSLQGASYPATIWHDYMEAIHQGLSKMDFLPYIDYNKPKDDEEVILDNGEEDNQNNENGTGGNGSNGTGGNGGAGGNGTGTGGNGTGGTGGNGGNGAGGNGSNGSDNSNHSVNGEGTTTDNQNNADEPVTY